MYGYRAKIGLIIPSINVAIEPEFAAMVPEGFSIHTTRVPSSKGTIEGEKKMLDAYYEFSGWDKEGVPFRGNWENRT